MGEHKHKVGFVHAPAPLECSASVSVFKIILILFVKFLLFVLRIILFPFGLVWLWGNMLRNNVYRRYPGY